MNKIQVEYKVLQSINKPKKSKDIRDLLSVSGHSNIQQSSQLAKHCNIRFLKDYDEKIKNDISIQATAMETASKMSK